MVQMNEQCLVISMLQCRTKGSNEWAVSGYFYVTMYDYGFKWMSSLWLFLCYNVGLWVQMNEQSLVISMLQCRTKGSNEWAVSGYFYVTM